MATPVLARTRSVSRSYGRVTALDGVSLDVAEGEALGLLGANGAGKSTLIQLLCGLRRPTRGTVELFGGDPRDARYRAGLGATPQETGLPETLRVTEVLNLVRRHFPDPASEGELLDQFGLAGLERRQTGGLSGGQKRRLALALAFAGRPRLVLLDEPTTGLDVAARQAVWDAVRAYRERGGTVLLSSHHLEEVEALAERVAVLDHGVLRVDGPVSAIRSKVPTRRVRLRGESVPDLPGILRAEHHGDQHELWTTDSDALVRAIVTAGVRFHDLEVTAASLEDAFRTLTSELARERTVTPA